MKNILILLLSLISFIGYAQIPIDPSLAPTTGRINAAIQGSVTASGTNTYTGTLSGITSYSGLCIDITFTNASTTTPCTFNLNSLGARTLKKFNSSGSLTDFTTGDIFASQRLRFYDNGTYLVVESGGSSGGGSGTVTSVSVTTANGVSGSVANATTTPAISLTLGAITPTTVNGVTISGSATPSIAVTGTTTISGTHSGSSSGTNTGDQTSVTGNAGTATALQTARTINGTSFDGTANITVTAAAGTLTGSTLNSGVTASSLTSVGTIATGTWNGTAVDATHGGTGQTTWTTGQIPYASASNTLSKLNIGTSGQFLSVVGGVPSWVASPGSIFTTPEAFGAVGDGTTNDQAALQSCVNSGLPCAIGIKNYRTNTTITVPSNAVIYGYGVLSIISTTSNISVFTVQGKNINFNNFAILGNSTGAAQKGIDFTGNGTFTLDYSQNRLNNMYFQDLNHSGVYATNIVGASGSVHTGAFSALNCFAEHCGTGYYMDVRAEYNILSDCQAHNCTSQGVFISGGNNGWVGGQITDNAIGVNLTKAAGEGNDAHGVVTGAKINHNTTAISGTNIVNGFVFSNNMIYNNGTISAAGCSGLRFISNTFGGTTALTINNCPSTEFTNNTFTTTPTATLTTTTPVWNGNTFTLGAVQPSFVKNTTPGTQRSSVSTQFDVTSSTTLVNVTGLTTLVNLVAGMRYCFDATLFTSSNVAGGVKFAIGGTATATAITYDALTFDNAIIAAQSRATSLGTAVGAATAVTAAYTRITGTIQVNAAGTLTIQFAQNASNGTASSVLVGSTFEIKELL